MNVLPLIQQLPEKYNALVIRERILVGLLMMSCVYFLWYVSLGFSLDKEVAAAEKKREDLLSLSESIMSQYGSSSENEIFTKNIAIIDKRINAVKLKMDAIDKDIDGFNQETIAIGEIVLLLRDVLAANDGLSLESLKVYPAEIIKKKKIDNDGFDDAFEKSVIALKLKGDYASVFDYLKKIEALQWSVFWQDVRYSVDAYPQAVVEIQLYTLSIIEDGKYYDQ